MKLAKCVTLTILCLSFVAAHAQSQTAACVQKLCSSIDPVEPLAQFLAEGKTTHPQLESFFKLYEAKLDKVRTVRYQAMKSAVMLYQDSGKVEQSLKALSDTDFLIFLLDFSLWNVRTKFENGRVELAADPLVSSDKLAQIAAIQSVFKMFLKASPLYRANLLVNQLNENPYRILNLRGDQNLQAFIINKISDELKSIPDPYRQTLNSKLQDFKIRMIPIRKLFGDNVVLGLGDLELAIRISSGAVKLTPSNREILQQVAIENLSDMLKRRQLNMSNLDQVYDKSKWDRSCKIAYNQALHYALTESELKNLNYIKNDSLRRARASVQELFGVAVASQLDTYLTTIKIYGPMSLREYKAYIDLSTQQAINGATQAKMTFTDAYHLIYDLQNDNDGVLENLCNAWIFSPIRDSENDGSIAVSSYSAKNPAMALAITTHEMGHAVSEGMVMLAATGINIQNFADMRACVQKNYLSSHRMGIAGRLATDKYWTEEDWADAFSGHSTKDLNTINSCSFLGAVPTHDYLSLAARTDDDPHSPTFYRILNINANREKPNICAPAIANEFPGTNFENCLKP